MKEKEKNPVVETADQAIRNYEQALRAGLKFQEETWQSWYTLLNQSPFGPDWQKRFAGLSEAANGVAVETQKQLEQTVELMEKNARLGADLMKKAVDASQTSALAESQSKWMALVKASLEAAQANVDAIMRINSRTAESLLNIVQKSAAPFQHHAARAA